MISPFRSLFTAAVALSSLVQGLPVGETERQVSVAVSPVADRVVVDSGGTYMRTTVLADGSLIGGYAASDGANRVLRVVKSTDGGDSWQRIGVVDSALATARQIDNAFPLALPDGRILYSFRNHDKNQDGAITFYRITVCVSEDGGKTWSFLSQIDQRAVASNKNGLWEPFLRVAKDGNIQAYYSAENNASDQDNLMKTSTDGGRTWGPAITVSGAGVASRDGMIGVADVGNGNLIAVFENTAAGPFSVDYVLSSDDGQNWGSRGRVYTAVNNLEAGAPQVINVGGTLVVSFMSNEAGSGPGVDSGEMKVVTSTDGGANWSDDTVISGLGSHWPGLQVLDDKTFLALYSFNGVGLVSHKHTV